MSIFGYSNVVRHKSYKETQIKDMLDNGKPAFVAAISGLVSGHAWVIDGYIDRSRTTKTINVYSGAVISSTTEEQLLIHCNWGWQGKANGYYVSKVFNTKKGRVENESYEEFWKEKGSSNFKWNFYTITYNHPITNK